MDQTLAECLIGIKLCLPTKDSVLHLESPAGEERQLGHLGLGLQWSSYLLWNPCCCCTNFSDGSGGEL